MFRVVVDDCFYFCVNLFSLTSWVLCKLNVKSVDSASASVYSKEKNFSRLFYP